MKKASAAKQRSFLWIFGENLRYPLFGEARY